MAVTDGLTGGTGGGSAVTNSGGITNPVLSLFGSGNGGTTLGLLIARLFRAAVLAGGLALLIMIVWGGLAWITAGGDKGKLDEARGRITNGIVGLAILVGTIAVVIFVGQVLGINLLNLTL